MANTLATDRALYPDLINNFTEFHLFNSEEDLLVTKDKWSDDSDYSNYRTIEDLLENMTDEDLELNHTVSVDIKDIWSSEDTLSGCDRPLWSITNRSAILQQIDSLNRHGEYRQNAAQVLSAMLRPDPERPGVWQIVKYIGNNRVAMKLLANNGKSTRVIMNVSFHEEGMETKQYIAIESELHATDAGDRSGQNEKQKFVSGYRANRENECETFRFLRKHNYNYGGIMELEGVEGCEDWLTLTSLQGIKSGMYNGYFRKYGEENVAQAFETVKVLCDITKEKVVNSTPIECLSLMYKVYTTYGKKESVTATPMFTHEELHEYFVRYWEENNRDDSFFDNDGLMVNSLAQTGSLKDFAYICAREFWPTITGHWKKLREQKSAFSLECHANQMLIKACADLHLKKEVKILIA
jgi:hypothetical protein